MGTFDPYYNDSYESAAQTAQSAHASYLIPALAANTSLTAQPSVSAPATGMGDVTGMGDTAAEGMGNAAAAGMGRTRISTRNLLRGRVSAITPGAVNSIVAVDVGGGNSITAVVTLDSLRDLGLMVGSQVVAAVNANDVLLLG